jgi:hypothetical protein
MGPVKDTTVPTGSEKVTLSLGPILHMKGLKHNVTYANGPDGTIGDDKRVGPRGSIISRQRYGHVRVVVEFHKRKTPAGYYCLANSTGRDHFIDDDLPLGGYITKFTVPGVALAKPYVPSF